MSPKPRNEFCLEWKEKKILPTSLPSPLDSVTLQRTRKKVHWLFFLFVSSFSSSTKSFYRLSVCVTEKRRPLYKCTTLSLSLECVCVGAGVYQPGRDCCCCCWFANGSKASDVQTPNTWVSAFVAVASTDGSKRAIPGSQSRRRQLWTLINKKERKKTKTTLFKIILHFEQHRVKDETGGNKK